MRSDQSPPQRGTEKCVSVVHFIDRSAAGVGAAWDRRGHTRKKSKVPPPYLPTTPSPRTPRESRTGHEPSAQPILKQGGLAGSPAPSGQLSQV
jgi:hypothetical protein